MVAAPDVALVEHHAGAVEDGAGVAQERALEVVQDGDDGTGHRPGDPSRSQKPSWRSTTDSLVFFCSSTVRVTSWWPRLMVTL